AFVAALQQVYERAHPHRKLEIVLAQLGSEQTELRQLLEQLRAQGDSSQAALESKLCSVYPSAVQRFLIQAYRNKLRSSQFAVHVSAACYFLGTAVMVYLLIHRARVVLEV